MERLNPIIDKVFPKDKVVVFLHAHADDECFLSAGLIDILTKSGRKCVIVYASSAILESKEQTKIRQEEAAKSCKALGLETVLYMDYCDAKYAENEKSAFILQTPEHAGANLRILLGRNGITEPFILISYDKYGGYGNRDHIALYKVGRWLVDHTEKIFDLFEVTINRDKMSAWILDAERRLQKDQIPQLSYWNKEYGLPEKEIGYEFELSEEQIKLKKQALVEHKSQIKSNEFPMTISIEDFSIVFGKEYLFHWTK